MDIKVRVRKVKEWGEKDGEFVEPREGRGLPVEEKIREVRRGRNPKGRVSFSVFGEKRRMRERNNRKTQGSIM